jgi:hypothetical protein
MSESHTSGGEHEDSLAIFTGTILSGRLLPGRRTREGLVYSSHGAEGKAN